MPRRNYPILAAFTAFLTVSCNPGDRSESSPTPITIPVTDLNYAAQLAAAAESVTIAGREYELGAYPWRDFMPGANTGGSALLCVATVTALDGNPVAPDLLLREVIVIQDGEAWVAEPEPRTSRPEELEGTLRGGPRWEPYSLVDVGAHLEDLFGEKHFTLLRDVEIRQTF